MMLLEYEAKRLLRGVGIQTPQGHVVFSERDLAALALTYPLAAKVQVASGGRGKRGGVVKVDDAHGAQRAVAMLLETQLDGEASRAVLLEPWLPLERELYLSVTVDGTAGGYVVLYSPHGGIDVESGAPPVRYAPGRIQRFRAHELREVLSPVEHDSVVRERVLLLARRLLMLAATRDCLTVEINPLGVLSEGRLIAVDAKVVRDDAAGFRAPEIDAAIRSSWDLEPDPVRLALQGRLSYVRLEGDVGLISGGAGMTMAVMDLIDAAGGRPACFLDCSANPTPSGYRLAFEMLDADPSIGVILVSIFGGGTHMERVARVMVEIMDERCSTKPVVFRLDGTNADQIPAIFGRRGLVNCASIEDAVRDAVDLARSRGASIVGGER